MWQRAIRLFFPVLVLGCLESCGAVTLEPTAPEEPPPPPRERAPRLMRRDAGPDANVAAPAPE
jgi:hypothetical protein